MFFWNPESRALQSEIQLMKIFMFFFQRNSCPLFLNHFLSSSSFSVIHVRIDIKNYVDKDSTLFMFFLAKSPGSNAISRQKTPRIACGVIPVN